MNKMLPIFLLLIFAAFVVFAYRTEAQKQPKIQVPVIEKTIIKDTTISETPRTDSANRIWKPIRDENYKIIIEKILKPTPVFTLRHFDAPLPMLVSAR